jgi:hypothetical protein
LIVIDSAAGGNASENVMIINSGRRGGTLADGVYDLRIGNAERTVADNLAAVPRTGLRIHAGSSRTTRLRNVHPDALIDGFVGPVTTSDGGPAPRKVTDDTLLGLEHNIVFADAGSGDLVLTLPDGVSAKEYQIIKQGDDNSVTLATFDAANRFADNTVEQVLVDDGDALCTATVGDRLWRFLPCAR